MNYSAIKTCDISNGVGVRTSLFVSGCRHRCDGCFNEETWPFDAGKHFGDDAISSIIRLLEPDYIDGLSILGGEPLEPENQPEVWRLTSMVKSRYPDKDIWLWTGFTWSELTIIDSRARTDMLPHILEGVDVLVDGRFMLDHRDIMLRFRGSPNQRLIDVQASLAKGHAVDWTDSPACATHQWVVTPHD